MPYTKFIKQTTQMTNTEFNSKMSELERAAVVFRDEIGKLETQLANTKACLNAIQIKRNCLRIELERERSGQTLFDDMFGG